MVEPDVLTGFTAETLSLPPDDEGPVVATLVARRASAPNGRAVLHLHGFCDYFFQTEYAEWWLARGYDFYALDLRKSGRSTRPHTTPHYVDDVHTYFAELELALHRILTRDGHDGVLVSGHSTGGLVASLWLHARRETYRDALKGLVLNSPWVDMHGPRVVRGPGTAVIKQVGARSPKATLPRTVTETYGNTLHVSGIGEWDYDLTWKPKDSFPIRFGWLAAIRNAHAELQAGLDIDCPVLVLSSDRTTAPASADDPDATTSDIVLDVVQIRRWATALGNHVTYAAVPGAMHDVFLSRRPARDRAYDEVGRWAAAYLT